MDNNLTFHVSSRSRFATISSVQPKKKIYFPPSSLSFRQIRVSPGEEKKKKEIAKLSKTRVKKETKEKEKQMKTAR